MAEGKIESRDVLVAALGLAIVAITALTLFVLSGIYSVSASRQHYDPTTWLLDLVRKRSVWFHSLGVEPPPLDAPGLLRLGAAHFEAGCASCHGAPGRRANAVASAMLPEPPTLGGTVPNWAVRELFWIVHNGQKYTGMPAWIAEIRDDEVWPVVAFLKALPGMSAETYQHLAGIETTSAATAPFGVAHNNLSNTVSNCVRCHGLRGAEPVYGSVPVLAGQSERYLTQSLLYYRAAKRQSGYMQLVASTLTNEQIAELAAYFSKQNAGATKRASTVGGDPERGSAIFVEGIPEQDVPPCFTCHAASGDLGFPRLASQPREYLYRQLLLFKEGVRVTTPMGTIMTPIAKRLDEQQMRDVAAYLGSL